MKIGEALLLGLAQDFHPLDYAPAERTHNKAPLQKCEGALLLYYANV